MKLFLPIRRKQKPEKVWLFFNLTMPDYQEKDWQNSDEQTEINNLHVIRLL